MTNPVVNTAQALQELIAPRVREAGLATFKMANDKEELRVEVGTSDGFIKVGFRATKGELGNQILERLEGAISQVRAAEKRNRTPANWTASRDRSAHKRDPRGIREGR